MIAFPVSSDIISRMSSTLPVVIIGSGPAAWTAAIYAARAKLDPLVLAGEQGGGQLMSTTEVENFPGFEHGILGPELMTSMRRQAERLGVKIVDKNANSLKNDERLKGYQVEISANLPASPRVERGEPASPATRLDSVDPRRKRGESTSEPANLSALSVIIATGATSNTLKLPGEDQLLGRGVGTCAVCDAPFFRGKDTVFVIGGGDSAMEEASELAKFARNVIILVRTDKIRASAIMLERIKKTQNVQIWYNSQAQEFLGKQRLERVVIARDGKTSDYPADGLFYAIGHTPATAFLRDSGVTLDEKGYILTPLTSVSSPSAIARRAVSLSAAQRLVNGVAPQAWLTDNNHESRPPASADIPVIQFPNDLATTTTADGIFAAGDCADPHYRQAITAAGFGCMAALDCQRWLENQ